ncbi:MAG TPA: NUDIX hydrolase [Bacillales bacterium]|nr:NUDIX hydrolase [Bacillales bacterium]
MLGEQNLFQIRATGVLIENGEILLVKQKVSEERSWSLPGGRVEHGETVEEAVIREVREETGLEAEVVKLLYVCEKLSVRPPVLHITFLLRKIGGKLTLPSNEFDENPISEVRMVPVSQLHDYHFSEKFMKIVQNGFPGAGSYQGDKSSIGL